MDYYNEHDPFAAAWLRELIATGEIPAGHVDERSIEDVVPSDLVGYRHCHFFAGIGGWALAMRFADWPDDLPLWTGSCPCQPFSAAGAGAGFADERHLWPAFHWLISQCRPRYVCGEQVASGDALRWWDLVATDLEGAGYACTAVDLPAASVGAPHKRSRLFWLANAVSAGRAEGWPIAGLGSVAISGASSVVVADAEHTGHDRPRGAASEPDCDQQRQRLLDGDCRACRVADASRDGRRGGGGQERDGAEPGQQDACGHQPDGCGDAGDGMGDAGLSRLQGLAGDGDTRHESRRKRADTPRPVAPASGADAWADCVWLPCTDGKARPAQPSIQPLAARVPSELVPSGDPSESYANATTEARVGRLRGYGNAIVPQTAAEVLRAWQAVMR